VKNETRPAATRRRAGRGKRRQARKRIRNPLPVKRTAPNVPHAQTHGLTTDADRRDELPAGFEYLQEQVDAFIRGSLLDDGGDGDDEIPTRRRAHHGYRGRIHRRILQVDEAIQMYGLFDRRGKLRVGWLTTLQALVSTAIKIDVLLGLQRRPRKIESPIEWLTRRAAEAAEARAARTDANNDTSDPSDTLDPSDTQQESEESGDGEPRTE
jgi:hypothetical protein